MFEKDRFVQDCMNALAGGPEAIRPLMAEAVSDSARVIAELGAPQQAGITPIYRSPKLTVMNHIWAPYMILMPHNHQMFSVVGIYTGREDNIFWRRTEKSIEAVAAKSLGSGEITILSHDVIHSVINPIGKMTCAIHVYGGDFFEPKEPRSQWDHETLSEEPWDIDRVKAIYRETEARFNAAKK